VNHAFRLVSAWAGDVGSAWNRFWFTPQAPHTLAALRILAGAMIVYTHLVWSLDLPGFLGPDSWIAPDVARAAAAETWAWSHLWYITSLPVLWIVHVAALLVFLLLTIGLWTRVTAPLTWLLVVSYCHRLTGSLFGLDQVNSMLAMYVMLGDSGAVWSLDARRAARRGVTLPLETIRTNIATRLIQVHLCVIYFFGGIAKMRGQLWWSGHAFWYSIANAEYQSLDMTWLIQFPTLMALATHLTVFWETSYCVLIWPQLTRPLMLATAVFVHGGIALFLGMPTFGIAMLIANLAFIRPDLVWAAHRRLLARQQPAA
jgi:hypothetical protein